MRSVRRATAGTTLIVVILLRDTVLADYPPPHAHGSDYYTVRRNSLPDRCVSLPSNMTLCRGVGYRSVRLPNLFGHDTLEEAAQHADSWVLLVNIHCHPDTQVICILLIND